MIKFDKELVTLWNKKIVFAPNGFGKTVNCEKIKAYYEKNNEDVAIFTRRKIQNLVNTYKDILLLGKTSAFKRKNLEIADKLKSNKELTNFTIKNYNAKNASEMKEASFVFSFAGVSNFANVDTITSKLKKIFDADYINIFGLTIDKAVELDKVLNIDAYNKILEVLAIDKPEDLKISKKKQTIFKKIGKYLKEIRKIVEASRLRECPLCGTKFTNSSELCAQIDNTIKGSGEIANDVYEKIEDAYLSCKMLKNDVEGIIGNVFPECDDDDTIDYKYLIFEKFNDLYSSVINVISNHIMSFKVDAETFDSMSKEYKENEDKISNENDILSKDTDISKRMVDEYLKIVNPSSSIETRAREKDVGIEFYLDGKKVKDVYEVLSESEIKRLSLVVLKATLELNSVGYIILDDPIDSYDDYYLIAACKYISEILKSNNLKGWYLTTNNFQAISVLSYMMDGCNTIVYNENPEILFNPSLDKNDPVHFTATSQDILNLNKNELCLINEYASDINSSIKFDNDIAFFAFAYTIRNFKEIAMIKRENGFINHGNYLLDLTAISNIDFDSLVNRNLEHLFMHYDDMGIQYPGYTSSGLTNDNLYQLYEKLLTIDSSKEISKFKGDGTPAVEYREDVLKKSSKALSGTAIVNLVLYKIVAISAIKFNYEKLLIEKLKNKFMFAPNEIEEIIKKCGLKKKINAAVSISENKSFIAKDFLDDYNKIFDDHFQMFNAFDHGLNQMFPPYLATSIRDIAKFKEAVETLDKKY